MKTETRVTHTPGQIRQAQDLAGELGHLNKGIPSLIDLYAAAPELLEALDKIASECSCAFDSVSDISSEGRAARKIFTQIGRWAEQAIAKADGR